MIELIDMDNITVEQAQEGHRALWNWLAENPQANKVDWPGWRQYNALARNACFACEINPDCCACVIIWPYEDPCAYTLNLYGRWLKEKQDAGRSFLAAQIRDLPWRYGDD